MCFARYSWTSARASARTRCGRGPCATSSASTASATSRECSPSQPMRFDDIERACVRGSSPPSSARSSSVWRAVAETSSGRTCCCSSPSTNSFAPNSHSFALSLPTSAPHRLARSRGAGRQRGASPGSHVVDGDADLAVAREHVDRDAAAAEIERAIGSAMRQLRRRSCTSPAATRRTHRRSSCRASSIASPSVTRLSTPPVGKSAITWRSLAGQRTPGPASDRSRTPCCRDGGCR